MFLIRSRNGFLKECMFMDSANSSGFRGEPSFRDSRRLLGRRGSATPSTVPARRDPRLPGKRKNSRRKLLSVAHFLQHHAPVQRSRSGCAKDKFLLLVLSRIGFIRAAVEVPLARSDIDPGRVQNSAVPIPVSLPVADPAPGLLSMLTTIFSRNVGVRHTSGFSTST